MNQKTDSTGDNDNKYPVCVCECDCRDKPGYMTLAPKRVIGLVIIDEIPMHKITKCCKHFASCKLSNTTCRPENTVIRETIR